jgi:hypothetical protein
MENLTPKWRGFVGHLGAYVVVIGALAMINLITSSDEFWFKWPAMGWGVGLAFHFLSLSLSTVKNVSGRWRNFLAHLGSYAIIITMLATINFFTFGDSGTLWFLFPALGWGAGLALHFLGLLLSGSKQAEAEQQEQQERPLEREEPQHHADSTRTKGKEKKRPRRVEYPLISKGQTTSPIQAHLNKALAYQAQIESLIEATANPNARARLQDLAGEVSEWVQAIEDLVRRIDDFQGNSLIRQDLEAVPQAITKLEAQLANETDSDVQVQLERTLNNRRNQLTALERLQNTMKRAEIQIESTLSALGTIYSQLLTGESTDHVADYSRLSAEVDEEVRLLQDRLEALEEVKLGRI